MSINDVVWIGLVSLLSVGSFSIYGSIMLILLLLFFIIGGIVVMCHHIYLLSEKAPVDGCSQCLDLPSYGIPNVAYKTIKPPDIPKIDKRLTGANAIDELLQEVLNLVFRDYVQNWYSYVSDDEECLKEMRECVQKAIIAFANRTKDVDWIPYFTTKLVDDFASHIRLFRQATAKLKVNQKNDKPPLDLESIFFDMETAMEKTICRDLVCLYIEHERIYLQDVCEALLYLLLPLEDFRCRPLRYIIREVLVNQIMVPTIEMLADPDYINQTIVWMLKDSPTAIDAFLTILKCTTTVDELVAVKEQVDQDIAIHRSKDSGGIDDLEIKQQLSSLLYLKKMVENRIERYKEGNNCDSSLQGIDLNRLMCPRYKLVSLSLDTVLNNNIALSYFIDFMATVSGQVYLFFFLTVESYRVTAEQQLSAAELHKLTNPEAKPKKVELLREAALNIYNQYLSDQAVPRVKLDEHIIKRLLFRIKNEEPVDSWFDEAQSKVYENLQEDRFFPAFKKSQSYIKLLAELDLLRDGNKSEDGDSINLEEDSIGSKSSSRSSSMEDLILACDSASLLSDASLRSESILPFTLTAEITDTEITKEGSKCYVLYTIAIVKNAQGSVRNSIVFRRYSDFHDFHMTVQEKFGNLANLNFPSKKTFNNMNKEFLEKRRKALNAYLQTLLHPDVLCRNSGLLELISSFFEGCTYEKGKGQFVRTMDTLVSPLRTSVRNITHVVKSVPDNMLDGMVRMSDNLNRVSDNMKDGLSKMFQLKGKSPSFSDSGKVAASIDWEGDDNIALQIMLLLLDEVFDLKNRNQWLRRRLVAILRQIIKATFGDKINRKIVDYVEWMTSAEQLAEYIKALKQAIWPNNILAETAPLRDLNTKMRTRVAAKAKMLSFVSDELKHIIGSETTRHGILLIFEMFQHKHLNKRLVYVLLEGLLCTLFSDKVMKQFEESFQKIHSHSPRIKTCAPPETELRHRNNR